MRRDARRRPDMQRWWEDKKIIMSGSVGCFVVALIIGIVLYSNDTRYNGQANQNQIISLAPENEIKDETESASTSVGKSIEEAQKENVTIEQNNINNENSNLAENNTTSSNRINKNNNNTRSNSQKNTTTKNQSKQVNANAEDKKNIDFEWPVKGEILKAFSVDNLLYSSTLQEWTVHNGVDIKAEKTTVVTAATDGTVKSIKNDPRFGLTVIIEHDGGYKTVYSNLLTAEFVVEGEKVNKGQTIGTVGNSANFEVADESHLHFEILKDGKYVDPTMYLK